MEIYIMKTLKPMRRCTDLQRVKIQTAINLVVSRYISLLAYHSENMTPERKIRILQDNIDIYYKRVWGFNERGDFCRQVVAQCEMLNIDINKEYCYN